MSLKYRIYIAMRYAPIGVAFHSATPEVQPSLSAFIVYEDVATGKKAKEVCDMVTERLGPGWRIEVEMSSFKALAVPQQRQIAIAAVARANLVIFSCHGGALPFEVWAWTELWLMHPVRPTALVALLDGTPGQTGHACAAEKYLAGLARRRGLDYFSHLYIPAAETAADQLMPRRQKEPNDASYCAANTCGHSSGLYTQ